MAQYRPQGIFCVEGAWSSDLTDRATVADLLEIMEDVDGIPFIHTRVGNEAALFDALKRWRQKRYSDYSIGYFAFHGRPGKILIGRHPVSLNELGLVLAGRCEGATLYFGSCSVLQVPPGQIHKFLQITKAQCVIGFNKDIDWLASAALDMILLQALALQEDRRAAEHFLRTEYGGLAENLGLEVYYDRRMMEREEVALDGGPGDPERSPAAEIARIPRASGDGQPLP